MSPPSQGSSSLLYETPTRTNMSAFNSAPVSDASEMNIDDMYQPDSLIPSSNSPPDPNTKPPDPNSTHPESESTSARANERASESQQGTPLHNPEYAYGKGEENNPKRVGEDATARVNTSTHEHPGPLVAATQPNVGSHGRDGQETAKGVVSPQVAGRFVRPPSPSAP